MEQRVARLQGAGLPQITAVEPIAGVAAIHTFLYLELHKQTYTWGVR